MNQPQAQTPALTQADTVNGETNSEQPNVITVRQSGWLISSTIIGVGVLTLPRGSAHYAKESGWMSVVLGAILAMAVTAVITMLANRFPGQTLVSYASKLLGGAKSPWLGRLLSIPFILPFYLYWGFSTALVARVFGEVVITTVLPKTPLEVVIASMLIVSFVLVMHQVETLARVNEILLPLIVIPVLAIALSSYQSAKFENMFPMFDIDFLSFGKGVLSSATSYLGFEIMVIFLAYTGTSSKLMKSNMVGIIIPGVVYTLISISGLLVFGIDELELLAWPTLELVKTTHVPGLILERVESAFLGVWVAAVFTSVGNLFYSQALLVKEFFRLKDHRWIALAHLPVFYWLSLQPPNIQRMFDYQDKVSYLGAGAAVLVPVILLLISFIRRMKGAGAR
ncbi:GerAB/ArcD/ProY family transporter [Paenibacillus cremeus]|nr:endospore germination permease [Paenibacillus cremeus]